MMVSSSSQMLNNVEQLPIPPGSEIHVDFINAIYWDGSAMVTAADVIDIPEQITGSGLEIENVEANLLGAFLTAFLTLDWTVVVDYEHTFDSGRSDVLVISNTPGDELLQLYRDSPASGRRMHCEESGVSENREVIRTGPFNLGVHRIALTRTAAKIVISVDGSAIVSDTSAMDFTSQSEAALGGFPGFGTSQFVTIRGFTIYPAADDADLPGLSSL